MKDLCSDNYKTSLREIEEDTSNLLKKFLPGEINKGT